MSQLHRYFVFIVSSFVGLKNKIMRKISAFNFLTLNGYFKSENEDISWHRHGNEEAEYSAKSLEKDNILLFGRKTYQMMESFWPTALANEQNPVVAKGMNKAEKIVFSTTLNNAGWNNTRIIHENMVQVLSSLKQTPGKDMTILGSGNIITQLTDAALIDEYLLMIDPVAIPRGTPYLITCKNRFNCNYRKAERLTVELFS
jgi:dihydrofolate reductase